METRTFTAPANTTLDAATTYYVLFHGENIWLESTTSDNEDTNGLSDWSVEDVRYRRDDRTTAVLSLKSRSQPQYAYGARSGHRRHPERSGAGGQHRHRDHADADLCDRDERYTASVASSVSAITLTPTVNDPVPRSSISMRARGDHRYRYDHARAGRAAGGGSQHVQGEGDGGEHHHHRNLHGGGDTGA